MILVRLSLFVFVIVNIHLPVEGIPKAIQRIHMTIVMATGIPYYNISSISVHCIFCLLILYCINSLGL